MFFGAAEYTTCQQVEDRARPRVEAFCIVKASIRHLQSSSLENPDARIRVIYSPIGTIQSEIDAIDSSLSRHDPVMEPSNPLMLTLCVN